MEVTGANTDRIDSRLNYHTDVNAIFIVNKNGEILYANRAAGHLYGYQPDEFMGRRLDEFVASKADTSVSKHLTDMAATGISYSEIHRHKNGSGFPVNLNFIPLQGATDELIFTQVREVYLGNFITEDDHYLLEHVLNMELGVVYIFDLARQQNIYVNRQWLTAYGYTPEESRELGNEVYQIFHPDDLQRIGQHHQAWRQAADDEIRTIEYRVRPKKGDWRWMLSRETIFSRGKDGRVEQVLGIAYDISERKQSEVLLSGQNQILELIAAGTGLFQTLTALIQLLEAQTAGMLGSILLLEEDGIHVRHGAAPSLPPEFVNAIDGQPIGPNAGSCGTAAYTRQAVFVEDIETDPLWAEYKAVALPFGLRACWSTPIMDSKGKVLGTFAMYYREPGLPGPDELKIINVATHLARIAIEQSRVEHELGEAQARLHKAQQIAGMGFLEWDLKTDQIFCSDEIYNIFGIGRDEKYTTPEFVVKFVHPDDLGYVQENLEQAIKGLKVYNIDHRIQRPDGRTVWVHAQAELAGDPAQGKQVLLGTVLDISRRKAAEAKAIRMSQLYAALSQCNQAIVRSRNEDELFRQICLDAVKFGGMQLAWIGVRDDDSHSVNPVASFGNGVDYLDGLDISLDAANPTGRGPTATAIREDRPFWCQDFVNDSATAAWHERSKKYGWRASASLPLHRADNVVGAINVYTDVPYFFDEDVQNLLVEMSMDISFAMDRFVSEAERQRVEAALREREEHLRAIVETEPECVKVVNKDGDLVEMNAAGLAMLEGDSLEQVKSQNLLEYILPAYRDEFLQLHRRVMGGETARLEFEIEGLKGTRRWLETIATPMRDSEGDVSNLLGITRDISERKISEERIHYMANFDALTGLPNRIQMAEYLQYAIHLMKRSRGQLAVLFIDIDQFKDINDTLGHSIGDALLIKIAERLKGGIREEDTASRMGGDEFIIILPDCNTSGAAQVAEKLLQVLSSPYHIESYELVVTASIGIAIYPNDGDDLETLSRCADTAMYRAKTEGRDAYRFFTSEMEIRAKRNMQLVNALRSAMEQNQFEVQYQPQIDIQSNRIIGVEALLRWRHPDLGLVLPAEFIPVAEDSRLILGIGEWVLRTATHQLKQWIDQGYPPMVMAVNLSAVQFRHASLSELVGRILAAEGLDADALELELTEGAAMQDLKGGAQIMNNLHARGVRLSIDDFGTGYSSLSYLKKFKVYKLKIDKSFVQDLTTDEEDKAIVAAIIGMAKKLGLKTIAEGVETAEQHAYLREQGCDEAQGYLYSRPASAAAIEQMLAAQDGP